MEQNPGSSLKSAHYPPGHRWTERAGSASATVAQLWLCVRISWGVLKKNNNKQTNKQNIP